MTTRRQFMVSVPAAAVAFAMADHFIMEGSPARAQQIDRAISIPKESPLRSSHWRC
jgi:hypothetical protein